MRRNPQIPEYPRAPHKLERQARPEQVAAWIERHVADDGGSAAFVGFGRWARRLFGKAQRHLAADYQTRLFLPRAISGRPGQIAWREKRNEYRLTVTRRTTEMATPNTMSERILPKHSYGYPPEQPQGTPDHPR